MARNPYRRYEVTEYQKEALKFLQPPEDITVSEWADKYRVLDAKTSAMPGPWRTEHTPYLKGIMDEFNNYETEEIVYVKPTQVGGTECLQNMVGYIVQQDPAPTMIVYPTDTLAKSISENRLQPMFKAAPELRKRFDENSQLQELQFDGMYLTLAGSNSPSSLASKAIRFLFLDEVDKYPGASKKEADPVSLARERTKTFHNRKIFITSTPTLKTGHIWKAKEDADIEKHYFVPCPHCGEYIELKWKQIHFPKEEGMSYADRAEFATYVCQECGCVITDQDKPEMLRKGEWRTVKENTKFVRKVAFWMNTLYSPFVRFSEIVKEFLDSKDDPEKLQNFVNSWLAEPWEDTKLKTNADLVMERQTEYEELVVPEWAKLLTAGVDVQENCLYWSIRAWGNYLTSQNIAHGQAFSFQEVERIMNLEYQMGYWIRQYSVDGMALSNPVYVDAKDVIFLYTKHRPSQVREMSDMSPTITRIRDANEFMIAVSVKERIAACLSVFIKKQLPTTGIGRQNGSVPGPHQDYQGKSIAPGMIKELNAGDEIQVVNPTGQATDAASYIKLQQRLVGAGQGISYEATSRDMSESNYSSTRQGIIEDDMTYAEEKEMLMEVMDEIYETFIISLWLAGELDAKDFWDNKDKYFEHAWITAPKKWIDPQKEANANKIALNTGQKTFKQIAAEQGRDWKEQIDEMAEVLEYAKDKGIDLGGVIFDQTAAELYEDEETPADNPQQTDGNQTGEETGQESEEGDGAEEEGKTDD